MDNGKLFVLVLVGALAAQVLQPLVSGFLPPSR